jgi:hypothetical protein
VDVHRYRRHRQRCPCCRRVSQRTPRPGSPTRTSGRARDC